MCVYPIWACRWLHEMATKGIRADMHQRMFKGRGRCATCPARSVLILSLPLFSLATSTTVVSLSLLFVRLPAATSPRSPTRTAPWPAVVRLPTSRRDRIDCALRFDSLLPTYLTRTVTYTEELNIALAPPTHSRSRSLTPPRTVDTPALSPYSRKPSSVITVKDPRRSKRGADASRGPPDDSRLEFNGAFATVDSMLSVGDDAGS